MASWTKEQNAFKTDANQTKVMNSRFDVNFKTEKEIVYLASTNSESSLDKII